MHQWDSGDASPEISGVPGIWASSDDSNYGLWVPNHSGFFSPPKYVPPPFFYDFFGWSLIHPPSARCPIRFRGRVPGNPRRPRNLSVFKRLKIEFVSPESLRIFSYAEIWCSRLILLNKIRGAPGGLVRYRGKPERHRGRPRPRKRPRNLALNTQQRRSTHQKK